MTRLTHFDEQGALRMVDVSDKEITNRVAVATCNGLRDGRGIGGHFPYFLHDLVGE